MRDKILLEEEVKLLKISTFALSFWVVSLIQPAYACDPYEDCSTCLNNQVGGCIKYGNDPACEIRKAGCQQCENTKVVATGASVACVVCVISSRDTPAQLGCAGICGGAAEVRAVSAVPCN